jgi:hypothetical protein
MLSRQSFGRHEIFSVGGVSAILLGKAADDVVLELRKEKGNASYCGW